MSFLFSINGKLTKNRNHAIILISFCLEKKLIERNSEKKYQRFFINQIIFYYFDNIVLRKAINRKLHIRFPFSDEMKKCSSHEKYLSQNS